MEYKRLGDSGLKVSRICLGCMTFGNQTWAPWILKDEDSFEIIKKAWESGINFFDTSNNYSNGGSERVLGEAIKKFGIPRDQIVIATKLYGFVDKSDAPIQVQVNSGGTPRITSSTINATNANSKGLSRKYVFEACEASLKRLQVDYIDLYQIHRWDYDTPIEETMCALNDLVVAGKVRYIGASSMWAWQFAKANQIAEKNGWTKFVSMQDLYNLTYREEEREMIPYCLDQGVGLIPWSPLAGGALVRESDTARSETALAGLGYSGTTFEIKIVEKIKEIAEKKKITRAQVALSWILSKSVVTAPIVGASKLYQLEQAIASLDVKLTDEEIKELEALYQPKRITGFM